MPSSELPTPAEAAGFLLPCKIAVIEEKYIPVNPKYGTIGGLPAYPRVSAIPEPVDYVISSIPAHQVLDLIEDCGQKGVKGLHLFTARFSETGRKEAADLEKEILKRAREYGTPHHWTQLHGGLLSQRENRL